MRIKKLGKTILMAAAIPVVLYAIFAIVRPAVFLGGFSTAYIILIQSITNAILAWGLSFSMITDKMDFSIVAEMILYEILATIIYSHWGFAAMIVVTLILSIAIGLLKAVIKELIAVRSMVIGLGIAYILASLGELIAKGRSTIVDADATKLAFFPWNVIILIAMGLITWYLYERSIFGAQVRAVGGKPSLAKASGISEAKVSMKISLYGSFCAGVAALYALARGGGIKASHGLESMTQAFNIMMCILIAFAISKYVDFTIAIFVGAISMSIIGVGLVSIGLDSELNNTVTSLFLLALMIGSAASDMKAMAKLRRDVADAKYEKAKSQNLNS